ncbi:MAG: FAD-linked oxidase C-terminal domain-containing protein [Promethearchaeota archaeon]|jgi:glycolate oxidase
MKYESVSDKIISDLRVIVGNEFVLTEIEEIFPYSMDAMDATLFSPNNMPEVVIQPNTKEEVSKILKLANKHLIPVVPRGSGSGLAGGALAIYGGIIVDMTRFDKILNINIGNNIVEVEAGVICDNLNRELSKYSYFFPPDPGSSSIATIGGMVGNNSGGIQAFKYGVTANYVLSVEVVLPTGEIMEFGSKTLKSTSFLNIKGLMVGSEGMLGIITKIALKIRPLPQSRKSGFFIFDEFESITNCVINIRKKGIVPNIMEFLDKTTTKVCFEYLRGEYTEYPQGYFLLLEVDGTELQVNEEFEELRKICFKEKPKFEKIAQNPIDRDDIIRARKAAIPALSILAPTLVIEDFTLNMSNLSEGLHKIEELSSEFREKGVTIATFGHLEGNLHPTFMFNEHKSLEVAAFKEAVEIIHNKIVLPLGGTITGEHGIGIVREAFIDKEHKSSVELMHKIKSLFDPNLILNPGKAKGSKRQEIRSPIQIPEKDAQELSNLMPLSCIRCGFCVSECPSYLNFRNEAFSPRGKMALIKGISRGNLKVSKNFQKILYACTLCGTCKAKCPALIETVEMFEKIRTFIYKFRR